MANPTLRVCLVPDFIQPGSTFIDVKHMIEYGIYHMFKQGDTIKAALDQRQIVSLLTQKHLLELHLPAYEMTHKCYNICQ